MNRFADTLTPDIFLESMINVSAQEFKRNDPIEICNTQCSRKEKEWQKMATDPVGEKVPLAAVPEESQLEFFLFKKNAVLAHIDDS